MLYIYPARLSMLLYIKRVLEYRIQLDNRIGIHTAIYIYDNLISTQIYPRHH